MYVSGYTGDFVLIETYWNVNYFRSTLELNSVQGINRNILECKYDGVGISFSNLYVLIETYWNVNSRGSPFFERRTKVLIETYWNVNMLARIGK